MLAKVGTGGAYPYYAGSFVYSGSSLTYIMHREGMDIASYNGGLDNKYRYNGNEIQDDMINGKNLDWYDYGARFYDPTGVHFTTMDPMAGKYPWQSPYCYAANNPIKNIDKGGKNPVLFIGGIVLTVSDVALISMEVITTGIIIHKSSDGSFALNQGVKDAVSLFSQGYKEPQKREKTQKEGLDKSQANVQKSMDNNIGKPSPDGTPDPKRDLSTVGKIVIGTGLAAETIKGYVENTTPEATQSQNTDNSGKTNQVELNNADAKGSENGNTTNLIQNMNFSQKEEDKITVPLRR